MQPHNSQKSKTFAVVAAAAVVQVVEAGALSETGVVGWTCYGLGMRRMVARDACSEGCSEAVVLRLPSGERKKNGGETRKARRSYFKWLSRTNTVNRRTGWKMGIGDKSRLLDGRRAEKQQKRRSSAFAPPDWAGTAIGKPPQSQNPDPKPSSAAFPFSLSPHPADY